MRSATVVTWSESGWFDGQGGQTTEWRMWEHLCRAYDAELIRLPYEQEELPPLVTDRIEAGTHVPVVFDESAPDVILDGFRHPEKAIYLFGRTGQPMDRYPGQRVLIPTPYAVAMFGISAAAIALDHRRSQWP